MKLFENLFKTKEMTCADELNILDIEGNIFYSLDNYLSLYIKVSPIAFPSIGLQLLCPSFQE